jgi:DNA-binding CsgD family transcriptional regulator
MKRQRASRGSRKPSVASSTLGGSGIFSETGWTTLAQRLRITNRELEIVRGVFDDQTELAIADNLGISPHTVHTHTERLRRKLAVIDRAALILKIVQEFLKLSAEPDSTLPPICGRRSAGLCRLRG